MEHGFFAGLIQNISLLLVFSYLYDNSWLKSNQPKQIFQKIIAGILIGVMGILLMETPWIYEKGISFDTRSILLSVSALFLGAIPALISMTITFLYRLNMGGDGVWMGIMVVVSSAILGLIWRHLFKKITKARPALSFLLLGIVVHITMLLCTMFLPVEKSSATLRAIALPTLTLYPLGTMLLGILLNKQQLNWENRKAKENLQEMHRRFSDMMQNIQLISLIINTEGKIIFCNEYLLKLTGYSWEEIKHKSWIEVFIPEEIKPGLSTLANELLKDKQMAYHENEIITKNGERLMIAWNNTLLINENGKAEGVASIGENITDKKQYIDALKKSEEKFNILFNSGPDAMMITRVSDSIITDINESASIISGYDRNDFIGKKIADTHIWKDKKQIAKYSALMERNGKVSNYEVELLMKDKSAKTALISGEIVQIQQQDYILAVVRDITDRKMAEQAIFLKNKETQKLNRELAETIAQLEFLNKELIIQKEKAEESNRLKSAFLQNMSHEIRTPMNAIIGFSGFLRKPNISDEKKEHYLEIIQSSSEQLLAVVSNILTVSSLETKQEKPEYTEVDLFQLFSEMHSVFDIQASKKNIQLISKILLDEKQGIVITDKTKLTQIISNLLINAIKFTEQGSVEYGVSVLENELYFFVKDTGIGIKPEYQHIIFERFNQADKTIQSKYGGTGLGLSICKGFVELLGGKIRVESVPAQGTTFHFQLPYKPIPANVPEKLILSTTKHARKKVLVAEDEVNNFKFLEEFFSYMEIEVLHAENGLKAVEVFRNNPDINLILMDIKMPVMKGDAAAGEIKKLNIKVPIIAQTAYALDKERILYESIFDDYLTKPIQIKELKHILSKFKIIN